MGTVLSFGVLYPAFLKDLGRSREKTAWIGSLPVSIMSVSAVVSGALCDKLGSRLTGYLGTVVCSAGLLLSSFAPEIWIVYLTYGLLLGVGTGLIFTSIFSITAKYFNRFRALAVGIVGSGEGLGILVMAPVIQLLLDALQLRNTLRVMAAMVLANTLEGSNDSGSSRELPMPRKRGIGVCGWIDWSLWKIPTFTVFTLASGLATLAAFIPQFFMVAYCKELGISADRAAWMYVYMGVASLIGHVAIGRLIDRPSIQPGYVYQVCWAIAGVSTLLSRLSTSYAYLSVYFVVFGFAFGAAITCCDVIMLTLVPEARGGTLGLVADVTHSYADTFYISGATILCAACIPFLMLYFRRSNYGHVTTDVNNVAVLNA
ncbi:predicted protein [Nematostella vectensis]|uniref:Major facilitator superfamily (MFS) profile domain-containing protein n=1 Tax=Nematostella vectensis TaxID=45351 RepID=A7T697_NEMVE|nr:predicted protein [Nematostella vectensis]|eukprot:XP_001620609.1 hypothetical protein NEMVEDRAFT_v1g222924 [Nematostella vectensis]